MKRIIPAALLVLGSLALTGCSADMGSIIPVPPPAAAASIEDKPEVVEGKEAVPLLTELAEGSLIREVPVGAGNIIFDYWTDSNPSEWESGDIVPVNVSLKTSGSGEMLYSATSVAAWTDGGELYHDEGNYTLTPPFSYFTTLLVTISDEGTPVTVRVDIVVETFKDSGEFVKVSVADTLNLVYTDAVKTNGE